MSTLTFSLRSTQPHKHFAGAPAYNIQILRLICCFSRCCQLYFLHRNTITIYLHSRFSGKKTRYLRGKTLLAGADKGPCKQGRPYN